MQANNIDKVVNYFTKLGRTYFKVLERMVIEAKLFYEEEEYQKIILKLDKIDPVFEVQGWLMEASSKEPVPLYNISPKPYASFLHSNLVKPSVMAVPKSRRD